MNVTCYSLPFDGQLITDEVLLGAATSVVVNDLDDSDLSGAQQTLVASQTDPPPMRRGMLWYKRGEGQLYNCQLVGWSYGQTYMGSAYSLAQGHGGSWGGPLYRWVGMAPRLETLGIAVHSFTEAGLPVVIGGNPYDLGNCGALELSGDGAELPLFANRDRSSHVSLPNAYRTPAFTVVVPETCATWAPVVGVVRGFTTIGLEYSVMASAGSPLRVGRIETAATASRWSAYGWPYTVQQDESTPGWRALVGWARQNQAEQALRTRIRAYKSQAPDIREVAS